jgi:hypothetical protein
MSYRSCSALRCFLDVSSLNLGASSEPPIFLSATDPGSLAGGLCKALNAQTSGS